MAGQAASLILLAYLAGVSWGTSPKAGHEGSATAVAVHRVNLPDKGPRDPAAMVLVGTALMGLGAAVRRAR